MATEPLLSVLMLGPLGFAPWQYGLIICIGVFNPVYATYRLEQTATDRVARTLSAWSISSSATIAAMTALWGLLASLTSPRAAIALAGLLILATPLLLPRHDRAAEPASPASHTPLASHSPLASHTALASHTPPVSPGMPGRTPDSHPRPPGNDIDGPPMSPKRL
jgi:hypothetical protein